MAQTLEGKLIGETFPGLIKTSGNDELLGPTILTDGCGTSSSLQIGTVGDGIDVTGAITGTSVAATGSVTAQTSVVGGNISTTGFLHAATTAGNKVGIGTSSPGQKLTVNGSISANGDMYLDDGNIFTSNGLGTNGQILKVGTNNKIEWGPGGTGGLCVGNICSCSNVNTCNYISKFTPNGTTIGNSSIQENNSRNIGIGESPNNAFKVKVNGLVCSERFCGPITGNLTGNIDSDTCVAGNMTVNGTTTVAGAVDNCSTLDVAGLTTLASTKIIGTLRDCADSAGVNGAVLTSTGGNIQWGALPSAGPGANATGTVKGSGTTGRLTKFTNGCGIIGDSIIRETSGKIGVGSAVDASCIFKVNGGIRVGQIASDAIGASGNISSSGFISASSYVNGSSISTNGATRISSGGAFTGASLNVSGAITAGGDITAFASSDKRLKDNLTCITDSNNIINGLNNYCFDWNGKSEREGPGIGVIAQDVQKVLPNAVCERDNGYLAVDYNQFIPVLLQRVKELSAEVEDLKAKIS